MHGRLTVGHNDRSSEAGGIEPEFDCFTDARGRHTGRHGRRGCSEHLQGPKHFGDDHPVVGRHETLAPCHRLVQRIGGIRLVDDLLPIVLDGLGTDPHQNIPLKPRKFWVGHQLQHAVA